METLRFSSMTVNVRTSPSQRSRDSDSDSATAASEQSNSILQVCHAFILCGTLRVRRVQPLRNEVLEGGYEEIFDGKLAL
jgi:hypothetical protein